MKKNTKKGKVRVSGFLPIAVLVLVIVFVCLYFFKSRDSFENLKYDIVIQKYYDRWSSVDPTEKPIGGYSTSYDYILINTVKKEKYYIEYIDIWENQFNGSDTVRVIIYKLTDEDVKNAIDIYGKNNKLESVKSILADDITEEYKVTEISASKD